MLAYIWTEKKRLPSEIYNLHPLERELVYQMTIAEIKQKAEEAKRRKAKGG